MPIVENIERIGEQNYIMVIEVDNESFEGSPYQNLRGGETALTKASELFDKGLDLARNCAVKTVESIKKMGEAVKPSEFQLQFAVKLDTQVGAVLAKAGTGAQLQITMTWKSERDKS